MTESSARRSSGKSAQKSSQATRVRRIAQRKRNAEGEALRRSREPQRSGSDFNIFNLGDIIQRSPRQQAQDRANQRIVGGVVRSVGRRLSKPKQQPLRRIRQPRRAGSDFDVLSLFKA